VAHDIDAALYLMFQLASDSTMGYSASHALVCGTLCHVIAHELHLPTAERNSLVHAALTMNISMTTLQDQLADQRERPSVAQQEIIARHPTESQILLERLFITDKLWLAVVAQHHYPNLNASSLSLAQQTPIERLTRILGTIDRYAALISPRKYRAGRDMADTVRALLNSTAGLGQQDEIAHCLIQSLGMYPPGTFVQLDNGEIAVVLRRSPKTNHPLVASLVDKQGEHRLQPYLYETAMGQQRIHGSLAHSSVTLQLNHRTMVRLKMYAAKRNIGLRELLSQPSPV
jgi:HD-GYP domain-containing protein (c-di-GMP phosphodiesterase class II)